MPINVTCPECQICFLVGDEFAGRPGRCPECGQVMLVPGAEVDLSSDQPDPFDEFPARSRRQRDENNDRHETEYRTNIENRRRERTFDPQSRADRWRRVYQGLGYVQVAAVLGFVSQILQSVLMWARGGEQFNPQAAPDSGQIAMAVGALVMILAAMLFWLLGRIAALRVPYVPARAPARTSLILLFASVAGVLVSCCCMFSALGAVAQQAGNPQPPPEFVVSVLLMMASMFCTAAMVIGGEISALVSMARIGDGLKAPSAASWARRSIIVMLGCIGMLFFGFCALSLFLTDKENQNRNKQAPPGIQKNAQKVDEKQAKQPKVKENDVEKEKDEKAADPQQPAPAPNPGNNPVDEGVALVFDLILGVPVLIYLIHFLVTLQICRRAIHREIDALTRMGDGHRDWH